MKKLFFLTILLTLILTAGAAIAAPPSQAPDGQEYTVQSNDCLSKIADKFLGDALAYDRIVEATNAKAAEDNSFAAISNPDVIEVGQKLWIPTTEPGMLGAVTVIEKGGVKIHTYVSPVDSNMDATLFIYGLKLDGSPRF